MNCLCCDLILRLLASRMAGTCLPCRQAIEDLIHATKFASVRWSIKQDPEKW